MKERSRSTDSMGYPSLEKLVEQANPDLAPMKARHAQLAELSKNTKLAQDKASAKQAAGAYDRFFKFFDELIKVKNGLVADLQSKAKKPRR